MSAFESTLGTVRYTAAVQRRGGLLRERISRYTYAHPAHVHSVYRARCYTRLCRRIENRDSGCRFGLASSSLEQGLNGNREKNAVSHGIVISWRASANVKRVIKRRRVRSPQCLLRYT